LSTLFPRGWNYLQCLYPCPFKSHPVSFNKEPLTSHSFFSFLESLFGPFAASAKRSFRLVFRDNLCFRDRIQRFSGFSFSRTYPDPRSVFSVFSPPPPHVTPPPKRVNAGARFPLFFFWFCARKHHVCSPPPNGPFHTSKRDVY